MISIWQSLLALFCLYSTVKNLLITKEFFSGKDQSSQQKGNCIHLQCTWEQIYAVGRIGQSDEHRNVDQDAGLGAGMGRSTAVTYKYIWAPKRSSRSWHHVQDGMQSKGPHRQDLCANGNFLNPSVFKSDFKPDLGARSSIIIEWKMQDHHERLGNVCIAFIKNGKPFSRTCGRCAEIQPKLCTGDIVAWMKN